MTAPLVPRHSFSGDSVAKYVTPQDASLLEAVIEAASLMRLSIGCEALECFDVPRGDCECCSCDSARAYDDARAKVKP